MNNCNFVTTVGLADDERCLIQNMCVGTHWGSERIVKMLSDE